MQAKGGYTAPAGYGFEQEEEEESESESEEEEVRLVFFCCWLLVLPEWDAGGLACAGSEWVDGRAGWRQHQAAALLWHPGRSPRSVLELLQRRPHCSSNSDDELG